MSATPPPSDQQARTQRHLEYLDTLIAQGMDLAARLHQQSTTPSDLCSALAAPGIAVPFITPEVIASFAQINHTVRRAILVSRKLVEHLARPRPDSTISDAHHQTQPGPEPTQAEPVRTEFAERLYSPDLEDRIGARAIDEIIADLARDLGVAPPDPDLSDVKWLPQPTTPNATSPQPNSPAPHPKPAQTPGSRTGYPPAAPRSPPGPPHPA